MADDDSTIDDTAPDDQDDTDAEPFDAEGYAKLVQKLRNENKSLKGHRTSLQKQLDDAAPKLSEYDVLVEASKSDQERLQERAEQAEARAAARLNLAVTASLTAALTGLVPDPADVIGDLNLAKFVTDDDDIDTEAVGKLRVKFEALAAKQPRVPGVNPALGGSAGGSPDAAAQTAAATAKGDWRTVIALENQKLPDVRRQQARG